MICIDTDIFAIKMLFPRDKRWGINNEFLEKSKHIERCTTIFNVLEFCGIASFTKKISDVKKIYNEFHRDSSLEIIYPNFSEFEYSIDFFYHLVEQSFEHIKKKMHFSDSLVLWLCQEHEVETLVTWNTIHFKDRDEVAVINPDGYIKESMQNRRR